MRESELLKKIHVALSKTGRFFRNNVGVGWAGSAKRYSEPTIIQIQPGDVLIRNARPLHSGLCVGSSDLIGWRTKIISERDVGKSVAVFSAVEVKTPKGHLSNEQRFFLEAVTKAGGSAVVVRSVEDALRGFGDIT